MSKDKDKDKDKDNTEFFSEEFFLEENTTELTIAESAGKKPAVVIHCFTKASKEWQTAKSKFKVRDDVRMNQDQELIFDQNISLNKKKALAEIVTKITGLGPDDTTGDKVKELFVNPRARKIPAKLEHHLNTLGNVPQESEK